MSPRLNCLFALALCAAAPAWAGPSASEEPADGPALAERLRAAEPEENSDIHGTLIIRAGNQTRQIPMICRVNRKDGAWETTYDTAAMTNSGSERLVIRHSLTGPNEYLYARAPGPDQPVPAPAPVLPAQAVETPLAGSDFSLGDLGLEFLHWPNQRRLPDETHLDRACYVLESSDPQGQGITKVKSFFDKESGGLLIAEARDAKGQLVKEFSLHGSSFKKVNGHWRLEKMEISNRKIHSRTEIKFAIEP
jgi:hypothetical protein